MRRRRVLTTAILALGITGAVAVPAQAAPASGRHCVQDITTDSVTCFKSVSEADRLAAAAPRVLNLVRFWSGYNQTGDSWLIQGPRCTTTTGDIDLGWSTLGPLSGITSSVGKNPDGHCNWQLRGAAGATSTWVEGSWGNLATLGGGWDNRAVEFRLT